MTEATAFLPATTGGEFNFDIRQKFLALYPNRHKSILKDPSRDSDWVTLSRHASLTDDQLLNAVSLEENFLRGCRWSDQTKFVVLDIDKNSQLHNELGLARLKHSLASVGFDKPLLFQSSESEGWHLYLSLSSWTNCVEIQQSLKSWLLVEGYDIRSGQLEIFPSNNGLRLPLQRGFCFLDNHAQARIEREALTTEQAIVSFLDALDESEHSWVSIKTKLERRTTELSAAFFKEPEPQDDGFSSFFTLAGMITEVYEAGRAYWQNGLTKPGQRHHATLCVGHYLWYGDVASGVRALPGLGKWEKRAEVIEGWLREKHNGHSQAILRGDWLEVVSDIRRACNWTPSEASEPPLISYPTTERAIDRLVVLTKQTGRVWSPDDFKKGNIKREEQAREQIRLALLKLVEENQKITIKALERLSGCHRKTIRRHADIWAALRLSEGLGDPSCPGAGSFGHVSPIFSTTSEIASSAVVFDLGQLNSEQSFILKLTPCAEVLSGEGEQLNSMKGLRLLSPSSPSILASGSNSGALCECRREHSGTCGINGLPPTLCAGPSHLILGVFFRRAQNVNLTACWRNRGRAPPVVQIV